jgi:hypothetical protein
LLALKIGGRFAVVEFVFELALLEAAFAVEFELEFCAEPQMLIDSIMSINSVNFFIFPPKFMLLKSLYQMIAGMMLAFYSHIFYCQEKKQKACFIF